MLDEIKPIIIDEVLLQENRNLQILQRSLVGALKEVFGEQAESQRFIDTKRIPLICKDIQTILKNQEDVKNSLNKKEDDHEIRLRSLETFMNTLIGKMAMIGVGSSIVVSLIFIGIQYFLK